MNDKTQKVREFKRKLANGQVTPNERVTAIADKDLAEIVYAYEIKETKKRERLEAKAKRREYKAAVKQAKQFMLSGDTESASKLIVEHGGREMFSVATKYGGKADKVKEQKQRRKIAEIRSKLGTLTKMLPNWESAKKFLDNTIDAAISVQIMGLGLDNAVSSNLISDNIIEERTSNVVREVFAGLNPVVLELLTNYLYTEEYIIQYVTDTAYSIILKQVEGINNNKVSKIQAISNFNNVSELNKGDAKK